MGERAFGHRPNRPASFDADLAAATIRVGEAADLYPAEVPDPTIHFVGPLFQWIEERLQELIRESGFAEARPAFNAVFVHLPADGCRLTELARRADMSKQAMAELVDELVTLGYLVRFPDPADRRAKLILRSEKGLEVSRTAWTAFAQIDREIAERLGEEDFQRMRALLAAALPE